MKKLLIITALICISYPINSFGHHICDTDREVCESMAFAEFDWCLATCEATQCGPANSHASCSACIDDCMYGFEFWFYSCEQEYYLCLYQCSLYFC